MKIGFSKFISHLFFVLVLLLSVQGLAFAGVPVELTQKYSFTDGPAGSASTSFLVENLDLETYKKYNRLLSSGKGTTTMLAKAKPNALFCIAVGNKYGLKIDYAHAYFSSLKVAKGFPDIKGQQKTMKKKDSVGGGFGYTIPKGVEMVYVSTAATYNVYGTNKAKFNVGPYLELFIFTSDDAFQRAYAIFKEQGGLKKTAPAITNTATGKAAETTKPSNTKAPANSKDSGMSTTTMVGGAAALGALGWGALKFFGGGASAAAGGASGGAAGAAAPNNPAYKKDGEDLIYTDPATGAQSIYSQDADGNWVNRETGGVLDVGRVDDVTAQRAKDAAWQQEAMDDMVKKDKQRALDEISEAAKAKENAAQEAYKEKLKEKYGVTEGSEEALKEKIAAEQGKESQRASEWLARANTMDKTIGVMNFIQTAADTGISITSKFVPGVGVPIATVYTVTKNVAGGMMGGLVEASKLGATNSGNVLQKVGKMAVGTSQGILNAGIDVAQSFTSGKWLALSNIGGEAVKSTLEAGLNGENKTKAFVSGLSKGTIKQGLGMLTDKLAANQKTSVLNSSRAELKDMWKGAREKQEQIINNYAKGLLESQKAAQSKALADGIGYKGNPAEVAQKMRDSLLKMNSKSFLAKAEALDPTALAERASNVVKSAGDVAQGVNDIAFK